MSKTIEEEIRTYAQMCSLDEAGYVAIEKAIQFGIKLHESLPLSQRLTDEERERMKAKHNACRIAQTECDCLDYEIAAEMLEEIFGKELFGEELK